MSDATIEEIAQTYVRCPQCQAGFQQPCRTRRGPAVRLHDARLTPLRIAWTLGFLTGEAVVEDEFS